MMTSRSRSGQSAQGTPERVLYNHHIHHVSLFPLGIFLSNYVKTVLYVVLVVVGLSKAMITCLIVDDRQRFMLDCASCVIGPD